MDKVERVIKSKYPQVKVFVNTRDNDVSPNSTASPYTSGNKWCTVTRIAGYDNKRQKNMYIYQVIDLVTKTVYTFYRGTFISVALLSELCNDISKVIEENKEEPKETTNNEENKTETPTEKSCDKCDELEDCIGTEAQLYISSMTAALILMPTPIAMEVIERTINRLIKLGRISGGISCTSFEDAKRKMEEIEKNRNKKDEK
jgi:hypothetical protein